MSLTSDTSSLSAKMEKIEKITAAKITSMEEQQRKDTDKIFPDFIHQLTTTTEAL